MVKNRKEKRERERKNIVIVISINRIDQICVYCKYTLIKFYERVRERERERSKANKPIASVKSQHVYV